MKKIIVLTAIAAAAMCSNAQQALWGGSQIVSPEVNPDHTVTFRIAAPKAVKVQLTGDFLPTQKIKTQYGEFDAPGVADMVEKDGVWQYTTPAPLAPELYSYTMLVDGLKINDPSNVYRIRDVKSVTDVFIIPGERADLYTIKDVPHGTVSKVWYNSPSLGINRRLTVYTPAGYETTASATRCSTFFTAWAATKTHGLSSVVPLRSSTTLSPKARQSL